MTALAIDIAQRLDGRRNGKGYLCRCPVPGHGRGRGDLNRSLKVDDSENGPLFCCHAGRSQADVLAAAERVMGCPLFDRPSVLAHAKYSIIATR